jgi:hypothetical protein
MPIPQIEASMGRQVIRTKDPKQQFASSPANNNREDSFPEKLAIAMGRIYNPNLMMSF